MPLFRRRQPPEPQTQTPPASAFDGVQGHISPEGGSVITPSGQEYVAVPTEQTQVWIEEIADTAAGRLDEPVPQWTHIASAQAGTVYVGDFDKSAFNLIATAVRLGYWARSVELGILRLPELNEDLTDYMTFCHEKQEFGEDWFAAMCGATGTLVNAATQSGPSFDGLSDEVAALLAPEGLGLGVRAQLADGVTDSLKVDAWPPGVGDEEVRHLWYFGYYLHAATLALPPQAIAELEVA